MTLFVNLRIVCVLLVYVEIIFSEASQRHGAHRKFETHTYRHTNSNQSAVLYHSILTAVRGTLALSLFQTMVCQGTNGVCIEHVFCEVRDLRFSYHHGM